MLRWVFLVWLVFALSFHCWAADYFVDAINGDDRNSGSSPADAWRRLSYAIGRLQSSPDEPATVYLATGRYSASTNGEVFPISLPSWVSIVGAGSQSVILDGEAKQSSLILCEDVTGVVISGISAIGATQDQGWTSGAAIDCQRSTVTITDCVLKGNFRALQLVFCDAQLEACRFESNTGSRGSAVSWCSAGGKMVFCEVYDNSSEQGSAYFSDATVEVHDTVFGRCKASQMGGAVAVWGSPSLRFHNCLLFNNDSPRGGAVYTDGSTISFDNCTIADNSGQAGPALYSHNSDVSVNNSIVWANGSNPIVEELRTVHVTYSCFEGGRPGDGNIDTDPLFVPGPLGDFYLSCRDAGQSEDSPCIDAGSMGSAEAGLDDRTTRTDGQPDASVVDLGYHYLPVRAVTLYVDSQTGSDLNGGTSPTDAFRTISAALASLAQIDPWVLGVSVKVAPGLYSTWTNQEVFPLHIPDLPVPLELLGCGPEDTMLDMGVSADHVIVADGVEDVLISGFAFTGESFGMGSPEGYGAGLLALRSSITIQNCRFEDLWCIESGPAIYANGFSSILVEDSEFFANTSLFNKGGAIACEDGVDAKIINCQFVDNFAAYWGGAVAASNSHILLHNCLVAQNIALFGGPGLYFSRCPVASVSSCTIVNNLYTSGGIYTSGSQLCVSDSIIWGNPSSIEGGDEQMLVRHCCVEGGFDGEGNIEEYPGFVPGPLGDYYLCHGSGCGMYSPCIDAGLTSAEAAGLGGRTTDPDGSPDDGPLDIGYHYIPRRRSAEYWVDPVAGSNNFAGTSPEYPFRTISEALDVALLLGQEETTIWLLPGSYGPFANGDAFPISLCGNLRLANAPGHPTPVLDGMDISAHIISCAGAAGVVLEGLSITGGDAQLDPARPMGGGLLCQASQVVVRDCSFAECCGAKGGAIASVEGSELLVQGCTFIHDYATQGGALFCDRRSSIEAAHCALRNNAASSGTGGAVGAEPGSRISFQSCAFGMNWAKHGGAVWCFDGTLIDCDFSGNEAVGGVGGAVYARGELVVQGCSLTSSTAKRGCALDCGYGSNVWLDRCNIYHNRGSGGGLILATGAELFLSNCALFSNEGTSGPVINCRDGSKLNIMNSVLCSNEARSSAIVLVEGSQANIVNCTFAQNLSQDCVVISSRHLASVSVLNSILWDNFAQLECSDDGSTLCVEYSCVQGGYEGEGVIDADPLFTKGQFGPYYLCCVQAGQDRDSPCIDAGLGNASELGLGDKTTRTDSAPDVGPVDMGYHFPIPRPTLGCFVDADEYLRGDALFAGLLVENPGPDVEIDLFVWFVLPGGEAFWVGPDGWHKDMVPWLSDFDLPHGFSFGPEVILHLQLPSNLPPGQYAFCAQMRKSTGTDAVAECETDFVLASLNLPYALTDSRRR